MTEAVRIKPHLRPNPKFPLKKTLTIQALAHETLRALMAMQQPDGRIPSATLPGTTAPHCEDVQPPLLAWSVSHLCERAMRIEFLNDMYPRLVRHIEWVENSRKDSTGLYGWRIPQDDRLDVDARGRESGMDNSPRFDRVAEMTAVDLSSYMASEYYALEKLARCLDKTDDAAQWRKRRERIADLVNKLLWDDEDRFYYDLDEYGDFIRLKTTAGFLPLLGLIPDRDRAEALRMHLMNPSEFWSAVPACSVAQDERAHGNDTWRGAAWIHMNVLIFYGLLAYGFLPEARRLARASIAEVVRRYLHDGCIYECYDAAGTLHPPALPRKGGVGEQGAMGFGIVADFNWTASAFVHFTHELGQ